MGVNRAAASSVALLGEAYFDAVGQGQGIAAAERYFHPVRARSRSSSTARLSITPAFTCPTAARSLPRT